MIQENHLQVQKTARYFSLGELTAATQSVWIVLHGYGYHGHFFLKRFESIASEKRFIVAPEGLSKFYKDGVYGKVGASWMTKEDRLHEIEDNIHYLEKLTDSIFEKIDRAAVQLNVVGFSQGGATMVRWLAESSYQVDNLVLWSTSIPHDFDYEKEARMFDGSKNFLIVGKQDEFLEWIKIDELREQITKSKIQIEEHWFDGKHEIRPEELEWLLAKI